MDRDLLTIPPARRSTAIGMLVMVTVLWGVSFPLMKATNMLMERQLGNGLVAESGGLNPLAEATPAPVGKQVGMAAFYLVVRFALATLLLLLFMPGVCRGLSKREFLMGAATGVLFAAGSLLQVIGLHNIPASRSGFLTSLAVVFTPILMVFIERRLPRLVVLTGGLLALAGIAILTGLIGLGFRSAGELSAGPTAPFGLGDLLTITGALIFAGQILLIDLFSTRMPPGRLTPGMFAATIAIALLAFSICQVSGAIDHRPAEWLGLLNARFLTLVVIASMVCTVLTFYWMNKYQSAVSPDHAALIYTAEPFFATAWAMVLPIYLAKLADIGYRNESVSLSFVIGGILVIAGNCAALIPKRPSDSISAPANPS